MTDFRKMLKIPNVMNIHVVGAELFHADRGTDGRTDMTKLIVTFRSFANAPKNTNFQMAASKMPTQITFIRMHIS